MIETDVNNMLANAASQWRAQADNLDREASANDAEAARLAGMAPDLDRPYRAQAEEQRAEAVQLRRKATYADRGQYLVEPRRVPDRQEQALMAAASRAGRLAILDPRAGDDETVGS